MNAIKTGNQTVDNTGCKTVVSVGQAVISKSVSKSAGKSVKTVNESGDKSHENL